VRYSRMHTTAICSPTRASLLTGRNHSAVGMGNVTDAATDFEGYTSVIPKSAATVARVLRDAGYATAMFGKSHITPSWEMGPAGPFDRWPTGLGFNYFYGSLGGDTHQFSPTLYRGTTRADPPTRPDYILDTDLADDAIRWLREQQSAAPGQPFFVYYAPVTAHAPHHAPAEWVARFKGRFDQGWDQVRLDTLQRQVELGVVPAGTRLAERLATVPEWSTLTAQQRKVYARQMEVYAAALAFADHEIGRVVDAAQALVGDELLVVYLQGDNGASAEGGLDGTLNEHGILNGVNASLDVQERRLAETGGPLSYGHFSIGWACAMNTPFPWVKQLASHFGGTRNGMVIRWPGRTANPQVVRTQFAHVIDLAPTILDAAGVAWPATVDGVAQQPVDGVSLRSTFGNPRAPEVRHTQFFNIWDNMAIYDRGWVAASWPESYPWNVRTPSPTRIAGRRWQLFNVDEDFSQSTDLAAREPAKLAELQALFWQEAGRAKALPIHRYEGAAGRPSNYAGLSSFRFVGTTTRIAEDAAPRLIGRSFVLKADVTVPGRGADGVLLAVGGRFGGMSWHLRDGRPVLHYNFADIERYEIAASHRVAPGARRLEAAFELDPPGGEGGATVTLRVDGSEVARGRVLRTLPFRFSLDESFDVGADTGTPVTERYPSPNVFRGTLNTLSLEWLPR
jgi:arylsulfatase A-like enzyme